MASYTTPPSSGQGANRNNPLVPVTYTPQSSYISSKKSIIRPNNNANININVNANNINNNNNLYRNHSNTSNISNSSTLLDENSHHVSPLNGSPLPYPPPPPQHQHPSIQLDYQQQHYGYSNNVARRSTEQLSSSGYNGSVWEPASQRQLAQQPVYHPSMSKLAQVNEEDGTEPRQSFQSSYTRNYDNSSSEMQQDVSSLNISSPPRQRQHENHNVNQNQQQQHYQPHQSFEQHFTQPYADGHSYPQPSPTYSSMSQLNRTSTGSSTTQTTWSQPSSPGFPPSSYNGHHDSLQLSEAALLLLSFNPGILSTIAVAFSQKMLGNEDKRKETANYQLGFPVTFTGKEAVDVIVDLAKLDDRKHALAIVRSLESQRLFFGGGDTLFDSNNDQYFFMDPAINYKPGKSEFPTVPTGVFPYSSRCYSFDCQPGSTPCYSYSCPNRQIVAGDLGRHNSDMSMASSQEKVWANSVPASIVAAASKQERNRQEAIFEVVNTEQNYVRDLELMEEIFINPLRAGNIVDPERREELIEDIFLNFQEILELNRALLVELRRRQEAQPLVVSIGDVFLGHIAGFEAAYLRYIPRIALSEFTYKREEEQNPKFAQFLRDCTRHPEARRLGLRHFVGQPYQRIPRYPLLLAEVVKRTEEGVPDRDLVQEVISMCKELGKKVDGAIPEGNKQLRLLTLQDKIIWKSGGIPQDLKLGDKSRKLHFECIVKRRSHLDVQMIELRIFLFDQVLLMTKEKRDKMVDKEKENMLYQVSKNPIPLELLHVYLDDARPVAVLPGREAVPGKKITNSTKSNGSGHRNSILAPHDSQTYRVGFQETKYTVPVTIDHRGRRGGTYTFYMMAADRDQFIEELAIAQARRQEAVSGFKLFKTSCITNYDAPPPGTQSSSGLIYHPLYGKRATCSTPYLNVLDGKRRIVIGTDDGVYVGLEGDPSGFRLALREQQVGQVSVLEGYHILLVLTGKVLKAFNLSCLDPHSEKSLQNGQQLGKSVQYFTAGVCAGRTLVITMKKKNAGESHFSAFEPVEDAVMNANGRHGFSLFGKSSKPEWFKPYTEFYVGSDSSQLVMLAKMVCVVCPKGFEILMLDNLSDTQVFPVKRDAAYQFLDQRPGSEPISMFKISSSEFLMCYSDFAFRMTKKGDLVSSELIEWEGRPESFAVHYPYVIAFENSLIEIRHIETRALEQIILGNNIRRLYSNTDLRSDTPEIHLVTSDINNPEAREIAKLIRIPPPPKTALEPAEPRLSNHFSPTTSHLMAPSLKPVLSTTSAGPAVLATHTQLNNAFHNHQQHQQAPVYNNSQNPNRLSQPVPPIPQRPSPRLSQAIAPSYPVHPYSPNGQAYPQVQIPLDFDDNDNSNHQQQQQQQQQQQYGNGNGSGHGITWSSGGYP
ncbi:RHO1 GDP-GTP exchange protein 2 [Entomortierella beljakovae]|nr:RHO1 GDP-GTP exchange protein 2 [Entomortierella beljakovae]